MRKRKGELYEFTVTGVGAFPFDMLRYDHAFPASERESGKLRDDYSEQRDVVLASDREPTAERWRSFGWRVVEVR